jgi:DNA repair protein RecO (recombination protein O)
MDRQARDHLQRCFVLHRREFGNTSLIVEVFSPEHGRFAALAKGARRPRGGSAAVLQPFQPLWLSWGGGGEVRTLLRSEAAGRPFALAGEALYCGLYLNELLVRLLGRGDPHADLFAFYHGALEALAGSGESEPVLRRFELQLLQELGYGPVLDREAGAGRALRPDASYAYREGQGLVAAAGAAQPGICGQTLLSLAAGEDLTPEQARELRGLMRQLLAPLLGPRPLKSRELFRRRG